MLTGTGFEEDNEASREAGYDLEEMVQFIDYSLETDTSKVSEDSEVVFLDYKEETGSDISYRDFTEMVGELTGKEDYGSVLTGPEVTNPTRVNTLLSD